MQVNNNHISVNRNPLLLVGIVPALLLAGCGGSNNNDSPPAITFPEGAIMLPADDTLTTAAKNAFINAKSGDVIVFPEGRFSIKGTLSFDADSDGDGIPVEDITIIGYGMDKTILDFESSNGSDGLLIQNGKSITIK